MRTAATFLVISLLVSACATTAPINPATSNPQIVRSVYDSFARGDVSAVLAALDTDVVWTSAEGNPYADRSPYRGPQAIAEGIFRRIGSEWSSFAVDPQEFIDGGETVVVLGRYSGTYKATARPVDAQFVHVWTLRNGKIVQMRQYIDTAQFQRVMTP